MNTGVIRAYPSRTGKQYVRVYDVVKLQEEYEASKAGSLESVAKAALDAAGF
jgi:hypothetical protein